MIEKMRLVFMFLVVLRIQENVPFTRLTNHASKVPTKTKTNHLSKKESLFMVNVPLLVKLFSTT